jgi:hypothetical protein
MVTSSHWKKVGRRLKDVDLKLSQELIVLITLMSLPLSFGTQGRILESRKDLSKDIIKKTQRREALRLKAEKAQQPEGYLAVEHCSRFVTAHTFQNCWNPPRNPNPRRSRARFDNAPSVRENSETFTQDRQTNNGM